MASLFERNGTYYARFHCTDRGRKRISLRTQDEAAARALLSRFERLIALGEADPYVDDLHALVRPDPAECLTLKEAFDKFLDSKRAENCKANTLRTYRETVGYLVREIGNHRPLRALTLKRIRRYVHDESVAPATRQKRYRQVRAFLNYYDFGETLSKVEEPRVEGRIPKAVRPDELEAIVEAMKGSYRSLRSRGRARPGQILWRAPVFQFAFLTGLRRSEIARLRWRDVSFEAAARPHLVLRKQKSRREERLPLSEKAAWLLQRISFENIRRSIPAEYVFNSPRAGDRTERKVRSWGASVSRAFARYRDEADVREELTFHSLRAGYITTLARSGLNAVAIKRLARHADIKTSLRYIEATGETFRAGLEEAFGSCAAE